MTLFGLSVFSALAAILLAQGGATTPGVATLQGTWLITSMNGRAMPAEPPVTLTISGTTYQQKQGGIVNERGTIRIDTARMPIAADFVIVDGPGAGMTQLAIVEVSGDTMRLSLDMPGANQRPADFTAKDGVIMLLAKKLKP
jgi:uncharacterized protein (TIGR03067 family)